MKKKIIITMGICGILVLSGCRDAEVKPVVDNAETPTPVYTDEIADDVEDYRDEYREEEEDDFGNLADITGENIVIEEIVVDEESGMRTFNYSGATLEDVKSYIEDIEMLGYGDIQIMENEDDSEYYFIAYRGVSQVSIGFHDGDKAFVTYTRDITALSGDEIEVLD